MKFSECLKLARQQKGITQKQLAELLNVPVSTINRYENDNMEPRLNTVMQIAEVLHMSVDELIHFPYGSNGFPIDPTTEEEHKEIAFAYNFLTKKFFKIKYQDGQYYITTKKSIKSAIFKEKIPVNKTIVMSKKEFEIFLTTVNSNLEGYLRAPVAAEALRFWFDLATAQSYINKGLLPEDTFKFINLGSNSYYTSLNEFT